MAETLVHVLLNTACGGHPDDLAQIELGVENLEAALQEAHSVRIRLQLQVGKATNGLPPAESDEDVNPNPVADHIDTLIAEDDTDDTRISEIEAKLEGGRPS